MGARLYSFRRAWVGAPQEGLIRKGLSWSWKIRPPKIKRLKQQHNPILDQIVKKLVSKKVVEKTNHLKWQSRLFSVPKRESKEERPILDLSQINKYILCPTFKMLSINEVKLLLPKGCWTIAIDFTDGYSHLPVTPRKRPYLGFVYRGQAYQYRGCPFGLNVAPRAFTKVVSHVIQVLAKEGILALPYLDDLLIVAYSEEECKQLAQKAVEIIQKLGFIINAKKSRLIPAQVFEWLGVLWDLRDHTATTAPRKNQELEDLLKEVITSPQCTPRTIMRLQGLANWVGGTNQIVCLMVSTT